MFASSPTGSCAAGPIDLCKTALFGLGDNGFALPIQRIERIIPTPELYPLPLIGEVFSGVHVLGTDVVPRYNLHRFFRSDGTEDRTADTLYTVLYMTELGVIGLPADEVLRIVDNAAGVIETDRDESGMIAERRFVFDGTQFPLLDERQLLADLTG